MPSQQVSFSGTVTASMSHDFITSIEAVSLGPSKKPYPCWHWYSVPERFTPSSRTGRPARSTSCAPRTPIPRRAARGRSPEAGRTRAGDSGRDGLWLPHPTREGHRPVLQRAVAQRPQIDGVVLAELPGLLRALLGQVGDSAEDVAGAEIQDRLLRHARVGAVRHADVVAVRVHVIQEPTGEFGDQIRLLGP